MSISKLKDSLPDLDGRTLDFIFDHVYDILGMPGEGQDPEAEKLSDLIKVLKALQGFNYRHRLDETCELYRMAAGPLGMDPNSNSEGSLLWLAMLLAIKDAYGLHDAELKQAVGRINIRK